MSTHSSGYQNNAQKKRKAPGIFVPCPAIVLFPNEASRPAHDTPVHPVLQARSLGGGPSRSSLFAGMFCDFAVNAKFVNPDLLLLGKYSVRLSSHNIFVKRLIPNLVLCSFLFKDILFFQKILKIYFFLGRGEVREKEREKTSMRETPTSCLLNMP